MKGLKVNSKDLFKSRRTLTARFARWWRHHFHDQPELPMALSGYEFSLEKGIHKRRFKRPKTAILTISMLVSMGWWITSTGALYEPNGGLHQFAKSLQTDIFSSESSEKTLSSTEESMSFSEPIPTELADLFIPALAVLPTDWDYQNATFNVEAETEEDIDETQNLEVADAPESPWIDLNVSEGDTLSTLFVRYQLNRGQLHEILDLGEQASKLNALQPGQELRIRRDSNGNVEDLIVDLDFSSELHISRGEEGFTKTVIKRDINTQVVFTQGCVNNTLFDAGRQAGLSNRQLLQLLKRVFPEQINFKEIKQGDTFKILYTQYVAGDAVDEGDILAVEFNTQGKPFYAVRQLNRTGEAVYYKPTSESAVQLSGLLKQLGGDICQTQSSKLASQTAEKQINVGKKTLTWQRVKNSNTAWVLTADNETGILSWLKASEPLITPKPIPAPVVPKQPSLLTAKLNLNTSQQQAKKRAEVKANNSYLLKPTTVTPKRVVTENYVEDYQQVGGDLRIKTALKNAQNLLGTPYRYGGTTPSGFDCSGFVYYNYHKVGIRVPRTAHEQYQSSRPVGKGNLKPGDLVFFRVRSSSRIDHVGIYLGGDKFIHAEATNKPVTITSLNDKYYSRYFVGGGRN
ncbi:NlpC/P60 family protein [Beggiatoa alba]|uniref:NlpC/P60 family protein n=1 Tax=Beggiatoa alba TaxID=1022 RepID=UPI0002D4129F|nr:NlpC/P60 family protein [Beggiatoa alba]